MGVLKDLLVHGSARILGKVYSSGGFVGDLEGKATSVEWGGVSDKPLTYPPNDHDHKNEIVLFDDYLSFKCDKPTFDRNPYNGWFMIMNFCTIDDIDIRKGKRLNIYISDKNKLEYSGILSLNNEDNYIYEGQNNYDYTRNPIYINGKSVKPTNEYAPPSDGHIIYKNISYRHYSDFAIYISSNTHDAYADGYNISYRLGYANYMDPTGYPVYLLNQFWTENGEDTEQEIFNTKVKITLTDY